MFNETLVNTVQSLHMNKYNYQQQLFADWYNPPEIHVTTTSWLNLLRLSLILQHTKSTHNWSFENTFANSISVLAGLPARVQKKADAVTDEGMQVYWAPTHEPPNKA